MSTLKKYSDFQSLKAVSSKANKASPETIAQRHESWLDIVKALQAARKQKHANHSVNGSKQSK